MIAGQSLTLLTVRLSAALYIFSLFAWIVRRDHPARVFWSAACAFYLLHVAGAFQFYHHWSHTAAYLETARQTNALFRMNWGGGLYFNYAFTAVWIFDTLYWWIAGLPAYRRRTWTGAIIHCFLAFMFFNAVVIFAHGPTRWLGIAATLALILSQMVTTRSVSASLSDPQRPL